LQSFILKSKVMAKQAITKKVRFEIWLKPTDITYAKSHLVSSGQSVKNYIESLLSVKVASRKGYQKKLVV